MRHFYLLVCAILFLSCKKESQCMPYSEALKKGLHERKTTAFIINNDTIELDYVRDQVYKDSIPFCFGYIERGQEEFSELTQSFLEDYDPENVKAVSLFCEGRDICHGDSVSAGDARFIYIAHIDSGNYAAVDFINIKTGKKESHRVSELYATVQIH
ncbi:MAG TPA: hypothetical protein VEA37_10280, partial [Flavobacterium sp.]|nr:hypothetical protein [Flavobacterium sp.]